MVKQLSPRRARRMLLESLETRQMLTFSLIAPIGDVTASGTTSSTVSLSGHFDDPSVTGTLVKINVESLNQAAA